MQKRPLPDDFKVLVWMIVVLVIPFALTLMTIQQPRALVTDLAANPTPSKQSKLSRDFFLD